MCPHRITDAARPLAERFCEKLRAADNRLRETSERLRADFNAAAAFRCGGRGSLSERIQRIEKMERFREGGRS